MKVDNVSIETCRLVFLVNLLVSLIVIFSSRELGSGGGVVRRVGVPVLGLERCRRQRRCKPA